MKKIDAIREDISIRLPEEMGEQGFKKLAPSLVEKDFLITEIIQKISKEIPAADYALVFCGGTCLSKAHQALDRMSEDVDFKIICGEGLPPSTNQLRKSLSQLKGKVLQSLESLGYSADDLEIRARDNNQYIRIDAHYRSVFGGNYSLRNHIQLELNFTSMQMPFVSKHVNPLADKWMGSASMPSSSLVPCVALEEAIAEKLIAFPRRLAHFLRRQEAGINRRFDETLVRHIYDVNQLVSRFPELRSPESMKIIKALMTNLILKDAKEFQNQHPQFVADAHEELRWVMRHPVMPQIENNYNNFLIDMIYAPLREQPPFMLAVETFRSMLEPTIEGPSPVIVNADEMQNEQESQSNTYSRPRI